MSVRSEVIRIINEVLGNAKKISDLPVTGSVPSSALIEVSIAGVSYQGTASQVSSGASDHWKGNYDASVDAYPSTGTILSGDTWVANVGGNIDINGIGVTWVEPGTLFIALTNTPGQTPSNWKVIQ
jgi:hypothetical protein